MSAPPAEARAVLALVGGAGCIAFAPILVRLSELPPTATALGRMALALPVFLAWAWWDTRRNQAEAAAEGAAPGPGKAAPEGEAGREPAPRTWPARAHWPGLARAGLCFAGDLAFWHWSIHYTSVANATLLANFAPLFVTLGAWLWLGEAITRRGLAGLALGLGGATLLVRASAAATASGPAGHQVFGDLLGLTTALFYAGYQLSVKDLRRQLTTPALMGGSTLVCALALLVLTAGAGEAMVPVTARGWAVLAGLALLPQVAGQGLIAYGLAHLPASYGSLTLLVQPALAAGLAWVLFDERMGALQGLGAAMILAGLLVARRASQAEASAASPDLEPGS